MTQVPTQWIHAQPDPTTLMADWDKAMDAINDLMGFPHLRGKQTMYPQVDIILRSSVHAPGYPAVNVADNPNTGRGGYHDNYLVRGPGASNTGVNIEFHEQGHAFFFPKFGGESESTVNLHHVAMLHRKFGYTLDSAFRGSLGDDNTFQTLDTTATAWMCVFNFAPRRVPMATAEKADHLKGHAKFVDIARLYGWDGLGAFWLAYNQDEQNGVSYSTATDAMLLRLSKSVGKDIRPLFHFWGIHPGDPAGLAASVAAEGLQPPVEIYDTLVHYKSLVPANNSAFRTFAQSWWGKQPGISGYWEEPEHSRQWDSTALYAAGDQQRSEATNPGETYNENSAADITTRVQELLDLYYPDGRPHDGYDGWTAGPFQSMLANTNAALDFDGGGLATGIEWVIGEDPTDGGDDAGIAPGFDNSDPDNFVFTYKRRDAARAEPDTSIAVRYGTDMDANGWATANHGLDGVSIDDTHVPEAGFHTVVVSIPKAMAGPGGKLFARLQVAISP